LAFWRSLGNYAAGYFAGYVLADLFPIAESLSRQKNKNFSGSRNLNRRGGNFIYRYTRRMACGFSFNPDDNFNSFQKQN